MRSASNLAAALVLAAFLSLAIFAIGMADQLSRLPR